MQRRLTLDWLAGGGVPLRFHKIRAHSRDRFNTVADRLAGLAAAA
jgi:hypothetical protein